MKGYIQKLLDEAPSEFDRVDKTPAAKHLFEVNENPVLLDKDKKQNYIHLLTSCYI